MDQREWLAREFEENRRHLQARAHRMLGSASEAEDAVQEAWLRLSRQDIADVDNLAGWLSTVVARVCLDMLRSRKVRQERPIEDDAREPAASDSHETNPEAGALMADAVGPALLLVLDTLKPTERLAFVLHDIFDLPFDEIATILGSSPAATRQMASRARRRLRGIDELPEGDQDRQREIVEAFLAASRDGDFAGLLAVLDPEIEFRADPDAVRLGGLPVIHGAREFAEHFSGTAKAARPVMVNGVVGAVWAPGGKPKVVLDIRIVDGKIVSIDAIADPARLEELELMFFEGR